MLFFSERRKTISIVGPPGSPPKRKRKPFCLDSSMIRNKRTILLAHESQFKR